MRILIDNILWHDNMNKGLHPWSFVKKKSSLKLLKVCNMGKLAWEINPEVKLKNLLKRSLRLLKQDYHLKKKKNLFKHNLLSTRHERYYYTYQGKSVLVSLSQPLLVLFLTLHPHAIHLTKIFKNPCLVLHRKILLFSQW